MKNEIETSIVSIGQLLQNKQLQIPPYQRPYKWSIKNVTQLLEDIQRFKGNNTYRIGTVVIHKENTHHNIVDGQQRCITFLLITKAIFNRRFKTIKNVELKSLLASLDYHEFNPPFRNEISLKNIRNNYREIERKIERVEEDFIDFFFKKCQVTYFVIEDISEAFQFFDSQNSRGRDLEPHDLLKAFHLREINKGGRHISEKEVAALVDTWEEMDIKDLSALFADFLYRVRGWSKGNSSRHFTKKDTPLFKGINLPIANFPYTQIYRMVDKHLHQGANGNNNQFPFQLDQTIINGEYFFKMITHYKAMHYRFKTIIETLSAEAQEVIATINSYEGRNRIGDKYVRMLFDCAVLFYVDKFGDTDISSAIEKIFIWAYSIRLTYQSLQMASVDNYVVQELNLFKIIRDATYKEEIINYPIAEITNSHESAKTVAIKNLFVKMNYYSHG